MSPLQANTTDIGGAEKAFRQAFDRLKRCMPECLPKGTVDTRNNIAKEAGRDPSALRKPPYPNIISETQVWIGDNHQKAPPSLRQVILSNRKYNRSLENRIVELKTQRDHVCSLLVETNSKILDLSDELTQLRKILLHQK